MKRTRVHLIRHGQVEGFEQKRYNGQSDVELTDVGRNQYMLMTDRLRTVPLQAIFSSDLSRCLHGAEMIARAHQLSVVPLEELRELDIGDWEGKPWDEIAQAEPERWQARLADIVHTAPPNGESVQAMADRVRKAMTTICTQHRDADVLVVAHGGVNRVILLDAIGAPLAHVFRLEQDFGCYNCIDYHEDGSCTVLCLNT